MTDHLEPLRIGFRRLGLVLTVVSAALTGLFGITMSSNWLLAVLIAVGLMCATVCSAYAWPFVADYARRRSYVAAGIGAVFACLSTFADLTTNFGSIAWQRGANIEEANVSTVKYDDSRAKVIENRANLELWKGHLAKLEGENAWIATVTADALRANLDSADEAIRQESKRGGCGPKCLKLKETKAELEKNIALAEQKADLTTKIAATQALVDKYRDESSQVVKVDSAAQKQNISLASMFTLSLDPTVEAQHWTDKGVAWLVALFFTFGAMGANFLGWTGAAAKHKAEDDQPRAMTETHAKIHDAMKAQAAGQSTVYQIKDDTALKLAELLRSVRPELRTA
jgi:hypothetical protein